MVRRLSSGGTLLQTARLMIPKLLNAPGRLLLGVGLLLPFLLVAIPAFVAYRAEAEVKKSFNWVTHTHEVQETIQNLVNSLVDAETGQRGFLLTRRDTYLEPYDAGIARVGQQLSVLRALTIDNPGQQQRLTELQPLVRERLGLLAETVAKEKGGDHEAAVDLVNAGRGKFVMDKIRGVLRVMAAEEDHLLWARQQQLSKDATRSTVVLWTLVLVCAIFAAGLLYLLRRMSSVEPLVMCAYSRTIEYNGEWLSFEKYMQRRFGIDTSHGLSPAELEKLLAEGARMAM